MATPTGVLFSDPQVKPLSSNTLAMAGCYYLFFLTGTLSPRNVYADGLLTTPLSQVPGTLQPSCTSDAAGRFNPIYLDPGTIYRVQLFSPLGIKLEDVDPYVPVSLGGLTGSVVGLLINPVSPGETNASVTPTNPIYAVGDPRRYGAVGDGATDDTAPYTVAASVWGGSPVTAGRIPHNGLTYVISQVIPTVSLVLEGPGGIKMKANTTTTTLAQGMISYPASTGGLSLRLRNLTVDGNQANQAANSPNFSIDFRSAGSSSTPTIFESVGCLYQNGAVGDIRVFGNQTGGLITAHIQRNDFFGGANGDAGGAYVPRYIDIADGVDLKLHANHFDFGAQPVYGRAGLVVYYNQAESIPTPGAFSSWVRTNVTDNTFNRCGRDQANGQGSIDIYGYGVNCIIMGNTVRNYACRAINVKGSDPFCIIKGNQVYGSLAGLVNTLVQGIVCNASTTNDLYNDLIIEGNIIENTAYDAIFVNGLNLSGAGTKLGVQIRNNITRNSGSGGSGTDVKLQAVGTSAIVGNQFFNNGVAITQASIQWIGCSGIIEVRGNQIVSPAGRAFLSNTGDNNSGLFLEFSDNIITNPGATGLGCVAFLSTIGGMNWDVESNRMIASAFGNATLISTDQSAAFTASTTGNVLTVTSVASGTILPGHLLLATAAGTALSLPGVTIQPYGTGGTSGTGNTGTYQLSSSPTNVASQAFITQGIWPATVEGESKTEALNNNVLGAITARMQTVKVDTAAAQPSGNLAYIVPGYANQRVVLKPVNAARVVTVVDNLGVATSGNIHLNGSNYVMNSLTKALGLYYNNATGFWEQLFAN